MLTTRTAFPSKSSGTIGFPSTIALNLNADPIAMAGPVSRSFDPAPPSPPSPPPAPPAPPAAADATKLLVPWLIAPAAIRRRSGDTRCGCRRWQSDGKIDDGVGGGGGRDGDAAAAERDDRRRDEHRRVATADAAAAAAVAVEAAVSRSGRPIVARRRRAAVAPAGDAIVPVAFGIGCV